MNGLHICYDFLLKKRMSKKLLKICKYFFLCSLAYTYYFLNNFSIFCLFLQFLKDFFPALVQYSPNFFKNKIQFGNHGLQLPDKSFFQIFGPILADRLRKLWGIWGIFGNPTISNFVIKGQLISKGVVGFFSEAMALSKGLFFPSLTDIFKFDGFAFAT